MNKILLIIIVCIGFFLRVYQVEKIPPSLSWDEVSIGYNAYSILKTGKDEHGRFFPLDSFIAYGDYKPPLAIYLTVPFVAVFGLNETAVRLPSAIAGTLTIYLLWLIARRMKDGWYPMFSALLLTISPWHIQLSRAGWEANIALMFVTLGAYFILSCEQNKRYILVCFVPFVASIYTFNSARYVAPLLISVFVFLKRDVFRKHISTTIVGLTVAIIVLLPIAGHLVSKESRLRFNEVNIFTDISVVEKTNARIYEERSTAVSRALHNRRFGYFRSYMTHFFDNFEPWFLFVRGDGNPKFSLQEIGQLYVADIPTLFIGVMTMVALKREMFIILFLWIVLSVVPAAVARETPHALRIENALPGFVLFAAYGLTQMISDKRMRVWKRIGFFLVCLMYIFQFTSFAHQYFTHYSDEYSGEWQYGYSEAISYIGPIEKNYDRIYITDSIGRPYMYVLFYKRFDPENFRRLKRSYFDATGFYHVDGFNKYEFVKDVPPERPARSLFVMKPADVPVNARVHHTIHARNGDPVLVIFDL